jgi:hypothetical protein
MPQVLYCILLVLALPQVAAAGGALGVPGEPLVAGSGALERAAPPLVPARGLDLGIEDEQMRVAQESLEAGQDTDSPRTLGDISHISPYEARSDRGLSFGFEIQPRSRIGALARKDDVEDPTLGDQLEKLIERPVFGLRGRYRF